MVANRQSQTYTVMSDLPPSAHPGKPHYITRSNWLRAAILGANDGIVSISALIVGVAAATPEPKAILTAGIAGLSAGAMSMAAGEYVSVSSQSDVEKADIRREAVALERFPDQELEELIAIYEHKGLSPETARIVAQELTEHDALKAHTRDELGIHHMTAVNPLQAAFASGATFTVAGLVPVLGAIFAPTGAITLTVLIVTVLALLALGFLGARAGGAPVMPSIIRVTTWGIFAMAVTFGVGWLFGVSA